MTKKWSGTRSEPLKTKRKASKERRKAEGDIEQWLREQGAVESVKYDEDTGQPYRSFAIDLTKDC
jgi:hypothetical protein